MKLVILLIGILLFSCSAFADDTVYSGWLLSGNVTKTTDGREFVAYVTQSGAQSMVVLEEERYIVSNGTCTKKGYVSVCQTGYALGYTDWTKPTAGATYTNYYKAYVTISESKTSLAVNYHKDKDSLYVNEYSWVTVYFNNTGARPIENIEYELAIPDFVDITLTKGCSYKDGNITWEGSLVPFGKKEVSFFVVALSPGKISQKGIASYIFGDVNATNSETFSYTVHNYSLFSNFYLNKTKLVLGDIFNLGINVSSYSEIRVQQLTIDFSGFQAVNYSKDFRIAEDSVSWQGDLGSKNWYLGLRAISVGKRVVNLSAQYALNGTQKIVSYNQAIEVLLPQLTVDLLGVTSNTITSDSVYFRIVNPSSYVLTDFSVKVLSNFSLHKSQFEFEELNPGFYNKQMIQFGEPANGTDVLVFDISFRTPYGQVIRQNVVKNVSFKIIEVQEAVLDSVDKDVIAGKIDTAVTEQTGQQNVVDKPKSGVVRSPIMESLSKLKDKSVNTSKVTIVLVIIVVVIVSLFIAVPAIFSLAKKHKKNKQIEEIDTLSPEEEDLYNK